MNLGMHIVDDSVDGKGEVRRLIASLESIVEDYADSHSHPTVFNDAVNLIDRLRQEHPEQKEAIYAAGELLKQLALAEDVPQELAEKINVSQEGLGDFITKIKKVFGGSGKPTPSKYKGKKRKEFMEDVKTYDREFQFALNEFEQAIKKYFLNDSWLYKQTMVEGKVSGEGICQPLSIGGKFDGDFEKAIRDGLGRYGKLETYRRECVEYGLKISSIDDKLCKQTSGLKVDNEEDEKKVEELVRKEIEVIRAFKKPSVKGLPTEYMGGDVLKTINDKRFGEHYDVEPSKLKVESRELDALDRDGVKKAAKLMLEIIKFLEDRVVNESWYMQGSTDDDGQDLRDFYDSVFAVDEYYDVSHWQTLMQLYDISELYNRLVNVLSALEKYIDRSIK